MRGHPQAIDEVKATHARESAALHQQLETVKAELRQSLEEHPKALEEAKVSRSHELATLQQTVASVQAELAGHKLLHKRLLKAAEVRATDALNLERSRHHADVCALQAEVDDEK